MKTLCNGLKVVLRRSAGFAGDFLFFGSGWMQTINFPLISLIFADPKKG